MELSYSAIIDRPLEEVFAYVSNPENWPEWISGTSEAKQTSPGPIGVGTTFSMVTHFLGRRFDIKATVTEYELDKKFAIESDGKPVPYGNVLAFERVDSGTRLDSVLWTPENADVGLLFKLAIPIVERMTRRQFEKDHENLKDLLEARAAVPAR